MAKKPDIESSYSVLLDTSFLIRLLKADDPLHANAKAYFRYFIENDVEMYISTISIAEYCVKGSFDDLPFQVCRIMPFNIQHAPIAGKYARVIFESANKDWRKENGRRIIANDTKLFAQGAENPNITYFVTSDSKSLHPIRLLQDVAGMQLDHIDINVPYHERFGIIDIFQ